MLAVMRFLSAATCAALLLLLLLLQAVVSEAQLMELVRETRTVAGQPGAIGNVNGYPGTSLLQNPGAICGAQDGVLTGGVPTTSVSQRFAHLLIGDSNYFRSFFRNDSYLGVWFGQAPAAGGVLNSDSTGPISSARVSLPYSCFTMSVEAPAGTFTAITYYVVADGNVWWVVGDTVYSQLVASGLTFSVIASSNGVLFLMDRLQPIVYRCNVGTSSATNFAPTDCQAINFSGGNWGTRANQRGLAATATTLFIATGSALNYYRISDGQLLNTLALPLVDVHFGLTNTNELYAASWTAIYSITIDATSTMSATIVAGVEGGGPNSCTASDETNTNGPNPTFCGNYRILPISLDAIYVVNSRLSTVRELLLPPVPVPYVFPRRPFPIGFVDQDTIMPDVYSIMDTIVNAQLGIVSGDLASVDRTNGYVDAESWDTNLTVNVPQRSFDLTTTRPAVESANFSDALEAVAVFYNRTDEYIYGDANLLPLCNRSQMLLVEHRVGDGARAALQYDLIYTDPTTRETLNDNPNITATKLLMPSTFGYGPTDFVAYNETTHPLLEQQNFPDVFLAAVAEAYSPDRHYRVALPNSQYNYDNLTPEEHQEARWIVMDIINNRLRECALANGDTGDHIYNWDNYDSSSSGSFWDAALEELVPGCVSQIGLTNDTQALLPGLSGPQNQYDVYVPNDFDYTFNISQCLDGTDWGPLERFLNSTVPASTSRGAKCGTGCIVGIAVAAAVVATIIIAVIVVLTSKRRRLATVVAAPERGVIEPKFASTLSQGGASDSYDMENTQNPLRPY